MFPDMEDNKGRDCTHINAVLYNAHPKTPWSMRYLLRGFPKGEDMKLFPLPVWYSVLTVLELFGTDPGPLEIRYRNM